MEAVVGAIVEFGLGQFKEAIIEEIKRGSLEDQLITEIKIRLEYMMKFLRDADSREETQSSHIHVKKVREVAHHIEDHIHRHVCNCAYCRRNRSSKLKKIYAFVKNIVTCRHLIQSDWQKFMSTLSTISDAHKTYTNNNNSDASDARNWYDYRQDALLLEEAELVGIDRKKAELRNLLCDSPIFKAICVVGMAGSGKSTLVKCAYNDANIKQKFDHHIWITVSESFKVEEVNKLLLDGIKQLPIGSQQHPNHASELKRVLSVFLQTKRYIVVLDDVWELQVWDSIKNAFPENKSSRVVITTRYHNIIRDGVNSAVYEMKLLDPMESRTLFYRKAFPSTDTSFHPRLTEISESILDRCDGLPLAIAIIGGALGTKGDDIEEWERFSRSLGAELRDDGNNSSLISITKIFSLSYYDLPSNLQPCFLYLSIFPEDYVVEKMRLIRLWVAEGFVEGRTGLTIEEVAEGYLNELVNRSLIQVATTTVDNKIKTCRIHDLWREIIFRKSKEQSFVTIVSEPEHNDNMSKKFDFRRMAIHNSINNINEIIESNDFSGLRSLLMLPSVDDFPVNSILRKSRKGFNLLKVLSLRGANLNTFPDEVFNLRHLKYLNMRDTQVATVPKSIGRLGELQTLNLKNTNVTKLPVEILGLKKLRHLLIYRYTYEMIMEDQFYVDTFGFEAPYPIGCLVNIQKLCCIEAREVRGIKTVTEIGKLLQLRRLGITKLKEEDVGELCSSLEKLSHLRSLSINSIDKYVTIDLSNNMSSFPSQYLRNLSLRGHLLNLPPFISHLNSLVVVYLRWSRLSNNPLPSFQDLPSLVELYLENAYTGEGLVFQDGTFKLLKKLVIESMENLNLVQMEDRALPCIEELIFRKCTSMTQLPKGLENLLKLKVLESYEMANVFVTDMQHKKKEEHWSIAHIHRIVIRQNSGHQEQRRS